MCDTAWGDCPLWSREEVRKARKKHTCVECKEPIPVGAMYKYFVGMWEDAPKKHLDFAHVCSSCDADWQELQSLVDHGEGVMIGGLRECIEECVNEEELPVHHRLAMKWGFKAAPDLQFNRQELEFKEWCVECGKTIHPGRLCFQTKGKDDKDFYICLGCHSDRKLLEGCHLPMPVVGYMNQYVGELVQSGRLPSDHVLVQRRQGGFVHPCDYPGEPASHPEFSFA